MDRLKKIIIGLEGHGREHISDGIDINRTVGWLTTLYPVFIELPESGKESDLIKSVKEQLRQVPDKGLGYGVLKYINKDGSLQGEDCWEIIFNYLGQLDNVVSDGKWFSATGESSGTLVDPENPANAKLTVNGFVQGGELFKLEL